MKRSHPRIGVRGAVLVLAVALLGPAGCFADRSRPDPSEVVTMADLSVQVVAPRHGSTVLGDRALPIKVLARDLSGERLEGVGYVVRRSGSGGNATLDSTALRSGAVRSFEHEFEYTVPDLPTNTQIDIFAVAYGPGTQARLSVPSSVIVVRCQPGIPGC